MRIKNHLTNLKQVDKVHPSRNKPLHSMSVLVKNGHNNGERGGFSSGRLEEEEGDSWGFIVVAYHCRLKKQTNNDMLLSLPGGGLAWQ